MKVKKLYSFILALVIFIVSNFIQRNLGEKKKRLEGRIGQIEKELTSFLQYSALATTSFNFAQLHFNWVIESTVSGNTDSRKIYMSTVSDQIARALLALDEAAGSVTTEISGRSNMIIDKMKEANDDGLFDTFYQNFLVAVKRTQELQEEVKRKIDEMGETKIEFKKEVSEISSKESLILNFTIAINFLILLFSYIERTDKKPPEAK